MAEKTYSSMFTSHKYPKQRLRDSDPGKTRWACGSCGPDNDNSKQVQPHNRHIDSTPTLKLKLVLGMTCPVENCMSVNSESGICAYTASNAIVLFDIIKISQIRYLKDSRKPLNTIRFSHDGRLLVTGESGYMPPVCVWDVEQGTCIALMYGHEYGIKCVAFSPKGDLIVSIGEIHDGFIYIWAWPSQERISSNRFAEKIFNVSFHENCNFFVTCGDHHIKFWYPEPLEWHRNGLNRKIDNSVLYGRPAILGDLKTEKFVDVVCGAKKSASFIYIATLSGHIGQLSSTLRDIVNRTSKANARFSSICVHDELLFVGSREYHIYLYNALTLQYLRCISNSDSVNYIDPPVQLESNVRVCFDHIHRRLTVISSDGKLTIWDVTDLKHVVKQHHFHCHCGGIACSDILPGEYRSNKKREIFLTVSPRDSTIRLWGLDVTKAVRCDQVTIIHTDSKPLSTSSSDIKRSSTTALNSMDEELSCDNYLTTIKACRDFVVTGDNGGTVVAYSMTDLQILASVKCHSRSVTCLEIFKSEKWNQRLLLSGGRDRQIVIYDMNNKFKVMHMMQLQSGSVTILKIYERGDRFFLVSGGHDRSLVISDCSHNNLASFVVRLNRLLPSSAVDFVCNDMEMSLGLGMLNGNISVYCMETLNHLRSFQASLDLNARVEKLAYHSRCNLILAACSNSCINIINYMDGTILASTVSHAAATCGLHLSVNRHCVVSSSIDGCIFIWSFSMKDKSDSRLLTTNLTSRSSVKKSLPKL